LKQANTKYNHELTLSPPYSNNSANAKTNTQKSHFQKEFRLANKIRNIVIAEAKESYMSKLAEKIARLVGTNSKAAWKAVCKCKIGNKINHKKTKPVHSNYPTAKGQKQTRRT
jgi:hypothetical protein